MMRRARPGDTAALDAFLARRAESNMFLRSNLAAHGLDDPGAPRGMRVYITENKGEISAAFGITGSGFLMADASDAPPGAWEMLRSIFSGHRLAGIIGLPETARRLRAALGARDRPTALDKEEGLYRLELAHLAPLQASIRPPTEADLPLLRQWIFDYDTTALGAPPDQTARQRAAQMAERALREGHTRLLIEDGQPVAKTGFNATLPRMVQIGGVYTPPALRNRGHARRAVAAHLAEARQGGVQTAILFTSGQAAARAYRAIGFEEIGSYALTIFRQPVEIGASP